MSVSKDDQASVEAAAHRAWVKYVLDSLASTGVTPWAEGLELRAIYAEGFKAGHAARDGELQAARALADAALDALRDITLSGISFDDERLKYIEVQIDRDDWMAALRVVAGQAQEAGGQPGEGAL